MTASVAEVRDRAIAAAGAILCDWVGLADAQKWAAPPVVDAVTAMVAPEIERPLQARITELEDASRDLVNAVNELAPQRVRDAAFDRLERLVKSAT